jgi:hypothetical protein
VRYRWRCLQPPDREYWCFTHLLDSKGKPAGYLDHKPLAGDPPLRSWQPGDTGIEQVVYRAPPGVDPARFTIKLGIYDPSTGDRLPVGALQEAAADRFTVADDGTAIRVR